MPTPQAIAWGTLQWVFVALAGVLYVVMSVRVALQMRRIGRRPVRWFFITFFFTAIPSAVVLLRHRFAWLFRKDSRTARRSGDRPPDVARGAGRACPHCGLRIDLDEPAAPSGVRTCPRCRMILDENYLA